MAERNQDSSVAPSYAAIQIARALQTSQEHPDGATRDQARAKIAKWATVLSHILDGAIEYGTRTPVKDTPGWATLEVMTGGFATGALLAGGFLEEHEKEFLKRLPPVSVGEERRTLNGYFLTDQGLEDLRQKLRTGLYDIKVAEEGALLVVAWLVEKGHVDEARALLDRLSPYFGKLRFYPIPAEQPRRYGATVHLQDIAATIRDLSKIEPKHQILQQKEAVEIWAPYRDQMVTLFLETVENDWPCRNYPPGWAERATALVGQYANLRKRHDLCREPERKGSHFFQLRDFLVRCASRPESLNGREVGRIRMMLQRYAAKYDRPGSARCIEFRRRQRDDVSGPMFHDIAAVVITRLEPHVKKEALDEVGSFQQPIGADESARTGIRAGTALPRSIQRKVERCLNDTVSELIRRDLITSGDTLARVLPQVTSGLRAAAISDPALRQLYAAIYCAFRRRRSLLLLNLEKQIQIEELPWVRAIDRFRNADRSAADLARQAMEEIVILTLISFPHAILPDKLLQELRSLGKSANIELPLVEEVAADIFVGEFSPKYVQAAKAAGNLLTDSFYAIYYGIHYSALQKIKSVPEEDAPKKSFWVRIAGQPDAFAELCQARAGIQGGGPAANGMIIEQQQVLTTQNLAVLFGALGLAEPMRSQLRRMAEDCFKWVCERQQLKIDGFHGRLIMVKNTAYAWRQMIFYLALLSSEERTAFIEWAREYFNQQDSEFRIRFNPALKGLFQAAEGSGPNGEGRQFLGWSQNHWLLQGYKKEP